MRGQTSPLECVLSVDTSCECSMTVRPTTVHSTSAQVVQESVLTVQIVRPAD